MVLNVVQGKPRDRDVTQIVLYDRFIGGLGGLPAQAGVFKTRRLHLESGKSAAVVFQSAFLLIAQRDLMLDTLRTSLAETYNHRRPGVVQPNLHCCVDNSEPIAAFHPRWRGALAHFVHQYLGRRAGHSIEAGLLEIGENIQRIAPGKLFQPENLLRTESIDMDLGVTGLQKPQQIEIPGEWQLGIYSPLDQDIETADLPDLVHLARDLIEGKREGPVLVLGAIERAESARDCTDVGVVDIAADRIGSYLRVGAALPNCMSRHRQFMRWQFVETQNLIGGEAMPADGAVEQLDRRGRKV